MTRPFPPALPHGELREIFPDTFLVGGTVSLSAGLTVSFSRNMTVLRSDGRLVLVNSVRLDDRGLAALDALGKVTDVVRLAGFHGMDDPFYKDRYGARVWAVRGQRYTAGFDRTGAAQTYLEPDVEMDAATTTFPLPGVRLYVYASSPPEGLLLVDRAGGIAISGDSLQNWATVDPYFNFVGGLMMRGMGFIRAHNVGPAWLKNAKPSREDLGAVLELPFDHLLPAHGAPVIGGARAAYRPSIERAMAKSRPRGS